MNIMAREHWDDAGAASGVRVLTSGVDTSHKGILYLDAISVSFDGFKALNALSLLIDDGELRCVIGPNGAGKTTMMDVVTGKTRPDTGTAFFGQTIDLTRFTEAEIATAGIGRKFQKPTVFEQHTVFENLELAQKCDKRVWPDFRHLADKTDVYDLGFACFFRPRGHFQLLCLDQAKLNMKIAIQIKNRSTQFVGVEVENWLGLSAT